METKKEQIEEDILQDTDTAENMEEVEVANGDDEQDADLTEQEESAAQEEEEALRKIRKKIKKMKK